MVANNNNTNTANQGKQPQGHASTMLETLAMWASKKRNPTNVVNIPHQELDNHVVIVALQRKMNMLKQKSA